MSSTLEYLAYFYDALDGIIIIIGIMWGYYLIRDSMGF